MASKQHKIQTMTSVKSVCEQYGPILFTIDLFAAKRSSNTGKAPAKAKARQPPPVKPTMSAYRPAVSAEQETDFMSSLLGDMDTLKETALPSSKYTSKSRKRKPSPPGFNDKSSSPDTFASYRTPRSGRTSGRGDPFADNSSDGHMSDGFDLAQGPSSDDDVMMSPKKRVKIETSGIMPAIEGLGRMDVGVTDDVDYDSSFDEADMAAFMEVDEEQDVKPKKIESNTAISSRDKKPSKPLNSADSKPSWLSVYDSLAVATDESFGTLNTAASISPPTSNISALEEDGSFRFFWLDYMEHEGVLYFIGKTVDKTTKAYVSCCVTVMNLQRNLFVLPREYQLDEDGFKTDVVPEMSDIYQDFDRVRQQAGIKSWRGKFVKRKYAFEEPDVPKEETQWLKVVYGFNGQH